VFALGDWTGNRCQLTQWRIKEAMALICLLVRWKRSRFLIREQSQRCIQANQASAPSFCQSKEAEGVLSTSVFYKQDFRPLKHTFKWRLAPFHDEVIGNNYRWTKFIWCTHGRRYSAETSRFWHRYKAGATKADFV